MAAAVCVRSEDCGLEHDPRRPPGHHCRHHASRIFWRDAAQRPSGGMASCAAGADLPRDELAAAHFPRVVARDWTAEARGDAECTALTDNEPDPRLGGR